MVQIMSISIYQPVSMKLLGIYLYVHQLLPLLYVSNVIYQNNLILIPVS